MKKNHYDVLNLAKNCTAKEIKDAYIKLSKKYHPDLHKNDKESHKKFVEINEAYSVLCKSCSRKCYDNSLLQKDFYRNENRMYSNAKRGRYEANYEFYSKCNMNSQYDFTPSSTPYYSMKNKITSIIFCCLLITFGTAIQLSAMKKNFDRRSHLAAMHLKEARAAAEYRKKHGLPIDYVFKNPGVAQNGNSKKFEMEK